MLVSISQWRDTLKQWTGCAPFSPTEVAPFLFCFWCVHTLQSYSKPKRSGASRLLRRPFTLPRLPIRAIWVAAVGSGAAWVLFGLAYHLLGIGLLRHATGDAADSVAVFTLSYLAGFLALIAPGGIGVREGVMALLLTRAGVATASEATWLVVASRLWLTVLEILPGALWLALSVRRRPTAPSRPSA